MKKVIFALLVLGLFLVASCTAKPEEKPKNGRETGFGSVTKAQCEAANGYWNECGSPCAGTDAEVCIQVCQVQCECEGIAGFNCPEGYKCRLTGKIADEMGVCVKE